MKVFSILYLILFLACLVPAQPTDQLVVDGVPDVPRRVIDAADRYQNIRSATFSDWEPHGGKGMLITTQFADAVQIHYVAMPGGARQQLTFFREPVLGARYDPRPGRKGFLFSMDKGGAEFYQLYYCDISDGNITLLTDGKSRNTDAVWTRSGRKIYFSSNLRNGTDTDVRVLDPMTPGVSAILTEQAGSWNVSDIAPDEASLIVAKNVSAAESYLYIVDVVSHHLKQINPLNGRKIKYAGAMFGKDGKGIYYISNEAGEFDNLFYQESASGKTTNLTGNIRWDVTSFALSNDGKLLAFAVNEDGISRLYLMTTGARTYGIVKTPPMSLILGYKFNSDGTELGLTIVSPKMPGDVFSINLATGNLIRWTMSELGGLSSESFATPTLIHYRTFDTVDGQPMISALCYKPAAHLSGSKKFPVVISIHGGPESQAKPGFNSKFQYFVNELGCAVIVPNVRGSTGYGKTFQTMDDDYKREGAVKDIEALLDWVAKQTDLDSSRVAVVGGSYGGYMVLASMASYGDRLRCGIDDVGISNFVTYLEHTQAYRRDLRRVEYGDERDPEMRKFLEKISPLHNADRMRKPLFVIHGRNDPRVPYQESEQIVKAVKANNVPVWYLLANNEGHGFDKRVNKDYLLWASTLFLEEFLLK